MQMQPSLSQASMENRRKKSTSGDSFSFPSTPNQEDSDFEFGSLTPDSSSCKTSPADHLFFNGRLQPHSFPLSNSSQNHHINHHPFAITSRTSSIGSKDSLFSSRSNSTNSSSSSARTSSSDSSERRLFHNKLNNKSMLSSGYYHQQAYGCSKRWQYITPVPVLNRDASKRRRRDLQQGTKKSKKKNKDTKKKSKSKKKKKGLALRFGRRIFRWFVLACKECHAMEPSKAQNKEMILKQSTPSCTRPNPIKN